jgi:hypothetical protein
MATAQAYDPLGDDDRNDYVPPEEEWHEIAVDIPETFDPANLQSFAVDDVNHRFEYAIDRGSLKTGDDGVTRFILVIRSDQGAINSSYEGLRCGHREYKVYAYGSGQGLTPITAGDWQTIPRSNRDYRAVLYEDLICSLTTGQANPPAAVFQAMRSERRVDRPFLDHGHE